MSERLEAPHSDNTMEFIGLTTPTRRINPETLILEDRPKIIIGHDETLSDLLNQLHPSKTVSSESFIFEDESEIEDQSEIFIYHYEPSSDLQGQMHPPDAVNPEIFISEDQSEVGDQPEIVYHDETSSDLQSQMHPSASQIQLNNLARSWENQEKPEMDFVYSWPAERSHWVSQVYPLGEAPFQVLHQGEPSSDLQGQMHPLETVNPETFIFEDQSEIGDQQEIIIRDDETLSDLLDNLYPSETVNPKSVIFEDQSEVKDQSEIFIYHDETSSDLQSQMHPTASQIQLNNLARSWENQEKPEMDFVYSRTAERSHWVSQVCPLGEAPFQLLHQDNALIPPTDNTRQFPAPRGIDHALMLQASENKKLDSSQIVFQTGHRMFASLIQSRRQRFSKLPSTARRRLTYDLSLASPQLTLKRPGPKSAAFA